MKSNGNASNENNGADGGNGGDEGEGDGPSTGGGGEVAAATGGKQRPSGGGEDGPKDGADVSSADKSRWVVVVVVVVVGVYIAVIVVVFVFSPSIFCGVSYSVFYAAFCFETVFLPLLNVLVFLMLLLFFVFAAQRTPWKTWEAEAHEEEVRRAGAVRCSAVPRHKRCCVVCTWTRMTNGISLSAEFDF